MLLSLLLARTDIAGIYGDPPKLPERMLYLHPGAAAALRRVDAKLRGRVICSDVFRSMTAQLTARREKRGTQRPGYSGHNFGLSIDIDVDGTCKALNRTYTDLRLALEVEGWHCHRRDGAANKFEWWHFNWFGPDSAECLSKTVLSVPSTWERAVERKIQILYADALRMDVSEAQEALRKLRLYDGEVDGIEGPLTKSALSAFRRQWDIPQSPAGPVLDEQTQRTLAVVSAERVVEELPPL